MSTGYKNDKFEKKVNLGVGAYRDNNGLPHVFPVVRKAEARIVSDLSLNKEYSPIDGDQVFNRGARGVLFGFDHPDVDSGRVVTATTLSGTGALRIVGEFLQKFRRAPLYISDPTWGNHPKVFDVCGLAVHKYRYFKPETKGLDIEGMI